MASLQLYIQALRSLGFIIVGGYSLIFFMGPYLMTLFRNVSSYTYTHSLSLNHIVLHGHLKPIQWPKLYVLDYATGTQNTLLITGTN